MAGVYYDDFENMDSPWARAGMKQAAVDLKSGRLLSDGRLGSYLGLIQQRCWFSLRPSAWVRGYLLIAMLAERLDRQTADRVCRVLKQPHWEIDHFPGKWLKRARTDPDWRTSVLASVLQEASCSLPGGLPGSHCQDVI